MGDDPLQPVAALRWQIAARLKGYRCDNCGTIPPYDDRHHYLESGMCAFCVYQSDGPPSATPE